MLQLFVAQLFADWRERAMNPVVGQLQDERFLGDVPGQEGFDIFDGWAESAELASHRVEQYPQLTPRIDYTAQTKMFLQHQSYYERSTNGAIANSAPALRWSYSVTRAGPNI